MLLSDVSPLSTSSYYPAQNMTAVVESSGAGDITIPAHSAGIADAGSLLGWFWLGVFLFIVGFARPPKSLLDDNDDH